MNDPRHSLESDLYFRSDLDTFVEGVRKSKSPQCFLFTRLILDTSIFKYFVSSIQVPRIYVIGS